MRKYLVLALLAFLAGCASNADEVVVVEPEPVVEDTIAAGSQEDLERYADHRVFFAYDQHQLTPQSEATLRKQAEWLAANPTVSIQLAGNCDERGTREYNLALGARRAEAARNYLVSLGVSTERITAISNGKEHPSMAGSHEQAWSVNRNSTTTVSG